MTITRREALRNDIKQLMDERCPTCVSLYHDASALGGLLPPHEAALKTLLRTAHDALPDSPEANALVRRFERELPALARLACSTRGLAVFATDRSFHAYALPFSVPTFVSADGRYHLQPLLAELSVPHRYYVLALSQNSARLLEVNDEATSWVPFSSEAPTSLDAATPTVAKDQLQFHSGSAGAGAAGAGASQEGSPVFHGQSPTERRKDEDVKRFLRGVATEVAALVQPDQTPLVLAGVSELTSVFRRESDLRISPDEVSGNPDELDERQLADAARPFAEPLLVEVARRAKTQAEELGHTDRVVADQPDLTLAAHDGRVEALFVQEGEQLWGTFAEEERSVEIANGAKADNEDLLDLAALHSFRHGASVFVLPRAEMPSGDGPAVALLRY